MSDEALYAEVVEELRIHGPRPGLWAKAFAEAGGDERVARAAYLKLRVQQLAVEQRRDAEAREAAAIAERLKREEEPGGAPNTTEYTWIAIVVGVAAITLLYFAK